uniref:Uncharacterized protein n=1 Tax=Sphenodon punctatus TaxID=8508 RepID=A0A8D0HC97_SPHPU
MNSVDALLARPFTTLTLAEKMRVKELGPDRPDIIIGWYEKKTWLCSSVSKNALFCFPCLLFGGEAVWTKVGVTNVKHLADKTKKHEATQSHMESCLQLALLGNTNILQQLDEGHRALVQKHNEEVDNNRDILSRIIDCMRFCGGFELALRGHDETENSLNPGVFRGRLNLMATIDKAVEDHFKTAKVFKGISKTIQNELLDCMLTVAREFIIKELQSTEYVAIQADDTTGVSTHCQSVLIYHYIDGSGEAVERFYGFSKLPDSRAETVAAALLKQLEAVFPPGTSKDKLIAQSYDAASATRGAHGSIQKLIRDVYPNAHYVHCCAHQLNLIMQQAVSTIKEVKVFFAGLSGLSAFFSSSPKRVEVLDLVDKKRVPRASATQWTFNSCVVNVVYENREAFIDCFDEIRSGNFDASGICEANRFLHMLEGDRQFLFFLFLFHKIMPHVDILYSQLQTRETDSVAIQRFTTNFITNINTVRGSITDLWPELPEKSQLPRSTRETLERLAHEVCDIILAQAQERFAFTNHLVSATLVQPDLFPAHNKHFPMQALKEAVEAYPMLQKERLKTELSILYTREEFCGAKDASGLLQKLLENNLHECFSETVSLLRIIVTTPMTTVESEGSFSALKRIQIFLQNTMAEDQLNALAMLSIEKRLIGQIPHFNHRTIELFAQLKDRRADFLYKQ